MVLGGAEQVLQAGFPRVLSQDQVLHSLRDHLTVDLAREDVAAPAGFLHFLRVRASKPMRVAGRTVMGRKDSPISLTP